jgi:DNA-binding NtrC family response regulator
MTIKEQSSMSDSLRRLVILSVSGTVDPLAEQLRSAGWDVHTAAGPEDARALLARDRFPVGVAVFQGKINGNVDWVSQTIAKNRATEWVAVVDPKSLGHGQVSSLIRERFTDYHTAPVDAQRLVFGLGHALGMAQLRGSEDAAGKGPATELIGNSEAMQSLARNATKIAAVDVPVLITGATGVGKEVTARTVHAYSSRADGPFVAVNCGALPEGLIQSELFGPEKGAFTDAKEQRIGRIEAADGGTLFLDEVTSLPLAAQAALLRFLQEGTIERVGGHVPIPVNGRVIAASNEDLAEAVRAGRFRADVYYRLNVVNLRVPPLRNRVEDIEPLARHYLRRAAADMGADVKGFSREALRALRAHPWPGNVRELVNRVRRAVLFAKGGYVTPEDLDLDASVHGPGQITLEEARAGAEREAILATLERTGHNVSRAAEALGVARATLYRVMDRVGIKPGSYNA